MNQLTILTEQLCSDAGSVKIGVELKEILEIQWKKDMFKFYKGERVRCLRCGKVFSRESSKSAYSRYVSLLICFDCVIDEALRASEGNVLNFREWTAFKESWDMESPKNMFLLTPECRFKQVFQEKDPATRRPVSEVAYSRSDHDGYRWWTKWFLCGPKLNNELSTEIDGFMSALLDITEFSSLTAMKRLRYAAENTNDITEFDLYSETLNFYIWIRVITRPKDYNLYVHYYRK